MASFQVEIVPSSPFFQNNLNNLDLGDLWVHHPQWQTASATDAASPQCSSSSSSNNNNKNNNKSADDDTYAYTDKPCKDKWARAREIVFPANADAGIPPKPSEGVSNSGGVSSLVQKWRGFEAGASKRGAPPPPPLPPTPLPMDDDSIGDWESDRTVLSGRSSIRGRDSDATESERLRVVDIIRKLTPSEAGSVSPPRIRTSLDHSDVIRHISPSPRIRGRQAYLDLLAQRERCRRKELDALHARQPVSKFSHRGRVQAVLKLKLLRGVEGGYSNSTTPFESHKPINFRPLGNQKGQNSSTVHFEKEPNDNTPNSVDQVRKQEQIRCNAKSCLRVQEDGTYIRKGNSHKSSEPESNEMMNKHKEDDESSCSNQLQMVETAAYWVADFAHPEDGWEELQSDYQTNEANNRDWIDEVSRPRSDWEYLRQERYQEMLDPFSENEEIRLLLCRKSVSNFLSSGMRDAIDQLMISRSQGSGNQTQHKKHQVRQGEEGEYFYEYEEAGSSLMGQQFRECDEYVDATTSQNQTENQNQNAKQNQNQSQGQEPSECSYQAASPSTQQSSTNYCSQDMTGRNSSYSAHPTFDMEIIYDLRRHMEQLHQEISELRKSMKCCTDMQIKIHRSIKKEVAAALTHPDAKNGRRHPVKRGTNGRRCCIVCGKVQVDCVLYKCGHMCTCFDCANELHWSSGRCPICRAQVLDVVRTHSNF